MDRVEAKRDTARHDAAMTRMDADAAGNAKAKVESELSRVQNVLAVAKEAKGKAEDEASRLVDEQVSLLIELGTCKDKCPLSGQSPLKRKRLWRRLTRRAST